MSKTHRIIGLDVVRAIAVLLVLARHGNDTESIFYKFGWLGVDLFFVLSGFLVSGLLFKAYLKNGQVRIRRFLVRRGLKIYPPFYVFVLFTLTYMWYNDVTYTMDKILAEIFYLQSYLPHIWTHTWSLAVEEHFYLLIALLVFIGVKFKLLNYKKGVISVLLIWLVLTFAMRFNVSVIHKGEEYGFMQSHLRFDGIIVGMLLSYLHHFTDFTKQLLKFWYLVLIIGVLLILPGFYWEAGTFLMNTYGLTLVNIGFGCFVLVSVQLTHKALKSVPHLIQMALKVIAFIGKHSYSIYLWHLISKHILYSIKTIPGDVRLALYYPVVITVGIVMSLLIERSSLKLRERVAA